MRPLDGVRVVDLTRVLAGPFCSMVLADLGADVVKVENPEGGDDARSVGPFIGGFSAYFASLNRNKRSVTVDLKTEAGKDTLARLLTDADVLLENFRPGTLDRLGFPWTRLHEINRGLICCRISGFGQTGPYHQRAAYDIIVQGMGGIMSITGQPGGIPTRVGTSIGDIGAAVYATIGVLAALRVRERTGLGQEIDISMLDCQVALLENAIARYSVTGVSPEPIGNRHPSITPFASVRTGDGYMVVAAGNDVLWEKLCSLLGAPELVKDPRFLTNRDRTEQWSELEPILDGLFRRRTTAEWLELLTANGVPCGPINGMAQVVSDPQVLERGMVRELEVAGARMFCSGNPLKFSLTPAEDFYLPPPQLGEHNDDLSRESLWR